MNAQRRRSRRRFDAGSIAITVVSVAALAAVGVIVAAVAAGYRPVVIQTGSMGATAPPGSLVVAGPVAGEAIEVGDIVVMRRPGATPVTHRVIELEAQGEARFAITQGDANESPDAAPYPLGDEELVASWIVPRLGGWMELAGQPVTLVALLGLGLAIAASTVIRRIWRRPARRPARPAAQPAAGASPADGPRPGPEAWKPPAGSPDGAGPSGSRGAEAPSPAIGRIPPPVTTSLSSVVGGDAPSPPGPERVPTSDDPGRSPIGSSGPPAEGGPDAAARNDDRGAAEGNGPAWRRRRNLLAIGAPALVIATAGVAFALFQLSEAVTTNTFGTAECFDPKLGSIQSGTTVHNVDGTISEPITAVDPTEAFVVASLRSNSGEPADSTVLVELAGGGTAVDLTRSTDAGSPPSITVEWSVVEYQCGVTVQRGVVNGDGTAQLDVAITTVDAGSAFVLASTDADRTATSHGANDAFVARLADPSTVRIRTTGSTFSAQRTFAWQVVEFDDGADLDVQTVTATLGLGVASTTAAVPTTVDRSSTFVIATVASAGTGPDIGERLIRTHLLDGDTVAIDRSVAGDAVEVHLQIVTLNDGSSVRHGIVDLATGEATAAVAISPVDPARSTAFSATAQPGVQAGGMTDHVADDVPGEASATFEITDPTTVTITRDATASNASFGWQVVEWAGPGWWDGDYTFRQRIDVTTSSEAAPDDYTVPLGFDHAALTSLGLTQGSGDDVRVLRWDGAAWTELDRVLDQDSAWNQVTTTVWFRTVDPIAASTTDSYWLYFGNPTPPPPAADPEAVWLLDEGFESGTLGDFEDRTGGTGWYQALPWSRRIPVTVAGGTVAADLTDFPLLVSVTSADLAANAQADGSDIRFTASDGTTPLAHEIERFDPGTGSVTAWVRVPTVSSGSATTVYLYFGAADAPDQQAIRDAWPSAATAAWHLHRDPAGPAPHLDDSTANNHDGLSSGSMTGGDLVTGLVGRAVDFDGTDDVLRADPFEVAGPGSLTVSAWVRLDSTGAAAVAVAKADDAATRAFDLGIAAGGGVRGRLDLSGSAFDLTGGTVGTGTWHHLAMTWDGTTQRLYLDGAEVANQPAAGVLRADDAMPVTVGNVATGTAAVDGVVDEVRIEGTARSAAWLDAAEANHRTPGSFASAGAVESGTWLGQGTWTYRKPVVVDANRVSADVATYPLFVEVTDAELQAGATASGDDLVFTAADGTTRLDHAVETYDAGTGSLSAWVLLPMLSSSADTRLFLYYGNASADDQQDPAAVFGPDADLVLLGAP